MEDPGYALFLVACGANSRLGLGDTYGKSFG